MEDNSTSPTMQFLAQLEPIKQQLLALSKEYNIQQGVSLQIDRGRVWSTIDVEQVQSKDKQPDPVVIPSVLPTKEVVGRVEVDLNGPRIEIAFMKEGEEERVIWISPGGLLNSIRAQYCIVGGSYSKYSLHDHSPAAIQNAAD